MCEKMGENTVVVDGITYEIDGKFARVVSADKDIKKAKILGRVDDYLVLGIGPNAFEDCEKLKIVIIEIDDEITDPLSKNHEKAYYGYEIGSYAFRNCKNLEIVEIPDGVSAIWQGAFIKCSSLVRLYLPKGIFVGMYAFCRCKKLKSIGTKLTYGMEGAFSECNSLVDFPMGSGAEEIEEDCFEHCYSLKKIVIPASLHHIGSLAFRSCTALEEVVFEDLHGWYARNSYISGAQELDLSNPRKNAKMLSRMDFDDGVIAWNKRK